MKKMFRNLMSTGFLFALPFSLMAQAELPGQIESVTDDGHRGGNGGDYFEIELSKRAFQISSFLNSSIGKAEFNSINPDAVSAIVRQMDVSVVSGEVFDKFGNPRTCVNENENGKLAIICQVKKIKEANDETITVLLGHEIFGLLGLEVGEEEDPSNYKLSSKLMAYHAVIKDTPIDDSDLRPEYYGLDNRSYGITYVNKKTNETIRLICLNDNLEVHRCRNYSVVRSGQGMQAPLLKTVRAISPQEISLWGLIDFDLKAIKAKSRLQKCATGSGYYFCGNEENLSISVDDLESYWPFVFFVSANFPVDFKGDVKSYRQKLLYSQSKVQSFLIEMNRDESLLTSLEKRASAVADVLNVKGDLTMVNKLVKISDENFELLSEDLKRVVSYMNTIE